MADLSDRLGRPLTAAEEARATALLADASAKVRSYTKQVFTRSDDETVVLRAQQGELRLPQRPVLGVASVVAIGADGAPDLPVVGWQWDGLDIVRTATDSPAINMPELWYDEDAQAYPGTYRVVYSHGDAEVPADVVAVVARMVLRTLTAPTLAGGVTGETIGPYSYRTDGSGVGTAVLMTDDDRRELADAGYRPKAGMSMVRRR
ncbi:hypothetical protein PV724_44315 [Streptomyces europaeiscabiei]|uniref:hypothetical protein n=1 Tax=Streptomyces europaeiscabiei TaxID=146819 RepID=UPI0029A20124|nr:hypothetical protein [Streptomyces europaeiscabiei]MDX3549503.1 hypothetical protein [Streptomyces europaeiscabiei]